MGASSNTEKAGIELTALDNGASKTLATVKGAADDVTKSADAIRKAWASGVFDSFTKGPALAVVGIIGGITTAAVGAGAYLYGLGMKAAEGAAGLKTMAEITGATVEGLSKIRTVAKISGADMDSIGSAMTKLAKNFSTGGDEIERALKAIGLSQKELKGLSTDEQFTRIAYALEGYKDGAEKTAVAQILMGKSGAQMLPIMRDLVEAGDLNVKVTAAQAREADDLEKNIKRLTAAKEAWKKIVGAELVPVLSDVVIVMLKLQVGAGGINDAAKKLAADGSIRQWAQEALLWVARLIDYGQTTINTLKVIGLAAVAVGADIVAGVATGASAFTGINSAMGEVAKRARAFAQDSRASFEGAFDKLLTGSTTKNFDALKGQFDESARASAAAAAHFAKFGDTVGAVKKQVTGLAPAVAGAGESLKQVFSKIISAIGERMAAESALVDGGEKLTEGQKYALGIMKDLTSQTVKFTDKQKIAVVLALEQYLAIEKKNDADKAQKKLLEEMNKLQAEQIAIEAQVIGQAADRTRAMTEENDKLREQIATFGMTERQLNDLNVERLRAKLVIYEAAKATGFLTEADEKAADELRRQIVILRERGDLLGRKEDFERERAEWASASNAIEGFLSDWVQHGRSAFGNLWSTVKKFFADTAAKFATKMVLNVLMDVSGGFGGGIGGFLSSLLGGGGAGGGAGGIGGILGSLAGGLLGTGGGIGTAAGVFQSVLAGTGSVMEGLGAAASALVESGGILGQAAGLLAQIPVVGWIAGAAALIYSIFGKNEKGIKFDNSLSSVAAAPRNVQRAALGDFAPSGDVTGEMLTAFQPFFNKVKGLDDYIATHLLSADTLESVRARIQAVKNPRWWNLEDKDAVEKASKYFLQQRYAAAFEDINATVAATIRNFAGTSDELIKFIDGYIAMTQVVAAAQASANAVLGETSTEVARIVDGSKNDVLAAYRAQIKSAADLAGIAPDSADALNRVVTGMSALRTAAVNLLVQVEQVRGAIGDMLGTTIRDLRMSIMNPQDQYAFLQDEANMLLAQALASGDPLQIQSLLSRINADVTQAMGLLDPTQRAAIVPEQIARLQEINDQINAHLNDIRDNANDQLALAMKGLNDALPGIVQSMLDAAAKQNSAADKFEGAADKLDVIDVNVNLTVNGQQVATTEG